ncbi:hypothetical protein HHI36_008630 [Cryptolaemus montrouzieri]|uniref:Uncharacterized protein n=1 Tax=Cryptolaemus montrouzieri TaxID=559131 RepID=A0ABD2MT09_9CUCU
MSRRHVVPSSEFAFTLQELFDQEDDFVDDKDESDNDKENQNIFSDHQNDSEIDGDSPEVKTISTEDIEEGNSIPNIAGTSDDDYSLENIHKPKTVKKKVLTEVYKWKKAS